MPFLQAPRGTLYYEAWGHGETVVLLHGMWSDHRCWKPMLAELSRTRRVLLVDHMGHGSSARLTSPYNLRTYASDLDFLLNSLGMNDVALAGFSMGASVALEYYFLKPDQVRALVLIATPPPQKLRWRLGIGIVSVMERFGITSLKKESIKALSRRYSRGTRGKPMGPSLKDLGEYDDRQFALILRSVWATGSSNRESGVAVPTLVVVGQQDGVREHSENLGRVIPRSRLLLVPDSNHAVIFTRPDVLAEAISSFLAEVPREAGKPGVGWEGSRSGGSAGFRNPGQR